MSEASTSGGGGEAKKPAPDWRVELIGRTDTTVYLEVQDGLGGVWSGSLAKSEASIDEG